MVGTVVAFVGSIIGRGWRGLASALPRVVRRVGTASSTVGCFLVLWLGLRWWRVDTNLAAVVAAVAVALVAPTIRARTGALLDRALGRWLSLKPIGRPPNGMDAASDVGDAPEMDVRPDRAVADDGLPPLSIEREPEAIERLGGGESGGAAATPRRLGGAGALPPAPVARSPTQQAGEHGSKRSSAQGGSAPPPVARPLLTRREAEVAGLIARGLTNRQIATELTISEKTVGKHLEHVMAKLGFQSRARVANQRLLADLVSFSTVDSVPEQENTEHSV